LTATGAEGPYNVQVTRATPTLARALGVAPALGRWFDADEGAAGGEPVAVLSHGYWQRRYGGSQDVVGQSVTLSGRIYQVVGVMPRGFAFPEPETELWIAHQLDVTNVHVGGFNYSGIALLMDGVMIDEARAELDRLIAQIPEDFPGDESAVPMVEQARTFSNLQPLKERVVGSTARTLWILFGAVSIVLAVACANVANLFIVRAESRQREVAVRRALGAGRAGIAGFYLAETMLLALAGGAIGLLLAFGGVKLLVAFGPPDLPRLHELGVGAAVLLFTLAVSVGAALALGAVALLRRRAALATWLHEAGRANTAAGVRVRTRSLLMASQIALALVLLVASALLARSFQRMRAVNPGYDPENALLVRPGQLFTGDYPTREAAVAFHERLLERVRALPGVRAAAATTCPPLTSYCYGDPVSLPGKPWDEGEMGPIASFRRVSDDYFSMMGIRLLRGRSFEERDQRVPTRAAIVDERMAALYFPDESALGKQILISDQTEAPYEIVGVVDHVLTWG
ncbi:MAG: ABC transporter permease, partial [Longimicrobiales bacterium]